MIGCWFTSPVRLLTINWVMVGLSSNLAQLFSNEPSLIVVGCFSAPLCCSYLIVSMKESHRCSSCCHSLAPLVLIGSLSLDTCYFDRWLQMVTTTTTLIDTLSILSDLGVIVALKLTGLVLKMFCTSIFLGHSLNLCSMLKQIIQG